MADTINNTPELSDQELLRCAKIATPCYDLDSWKRELQMMRAAIAADLLERLSPPQLVPVSERLPGPEDCDAQGRCWHFAPAEGFGAAGWSFYQGSEDDTHWLPAHALPLPSNTSRSI